MGKGLKNNALRGRPKKLVKYVKTINVRFTQEQWVKLITAASESYLEPSVFIRKTVLDALVISDKT